MIDFVSLIQVENEVENQTNILNFINEHIMTFYLLLPESRMTRILSEQEKSSWKQLLSRFVDVDRIDRLYDFYVLEEEEEGGNVLWFFYLLVRQKYGDRDHILIELDVYRCFKCGWHVDLFISKDHLLFVNKITPPSLDHINYRLHRPTKEQLLKALYRDGYHVPPRLTSLCRSFIYDNMERYKKIVENVKLNTIADLDFFQYIDRHTSLHIHKEGHWYRYIKC